MPANASSVTKFRALAALDRFFGDPDPATRDSRYDAAIARLQDPGFDLLGATVAGVEDIANGPNAAPAPLDHLSDHWLSGAYFANISSVTISDGIRTGFLSALQDARSAGLPLNAVWVSGADDAASSVFRVDHVVGPTCVTVVIVTPTPVR